MTSTMGAATDRREWWERLGPWVRAWISLHPVAARRIRTTIVVIQLSFFVVAIPTIILVPAAANALGWVAVMLLGLAILFWLARTKTVGWRMVSGMFTVSMLIAPLIAHASVFFGELWGNFAIMAGNEVGIAGYFEEVGKLLPLGVLAIVAAKRVRAFATVDWLLVGYACGAGFAAVEEAARSIANLGNIWAAMADALGEYYGPMPSLNPFLVASKDAGNGLSPGHQAWCALTAGSIGLGIALWRRYRSSPARWLGWVLPILAAHLAISDHMLYNATLLGEPWDAWGYFGLPWTSTGVWFLFGRGYGLPIIVFVFLLVALALDVERRRVAAASAPSGIIIAAGVAERTDRARSWAAGRAGFVGVLRRLAALVATAWFQWAGDAAAALRGYRRRPGEHWRSAQARGRVAISAAQSARRLAMAVTLPAGRTRTFRIGAASVVVGSVVLAIVFGVTIASVLGVSLIDPRTSLPWDFLAGLLSEVQDWWNDMPLWAQGLTTLTIVGLIFLSGGTLGAGFLWAGVGTYSLGHATSIVRLAGDPKTSIKYYLLNTSPGDMLADAVELGLTVLPIRIGPKGDIGELTTYLGGEIIGAYTDQFRGGGPTINEVRLDLKQLVDGLANPGSSGPGLETRPPGSFEGSLLELPAHSTTANLPAPGPDTLVVGRPDLAPNTAYEVQGRGTFYTDGDGRVAVVVESEGGSIASELEHAASGVLYVERSGFAYGVTPDGGLWATVVRLP
jgi:hypothetical protein